MWPAAAPTTSSGCPTPTSPRYADNGRLLDIGKTLARSASAWEPAVVDQFTRDGVLWGVPQLTDAGIAVYYNADLLAAAGIDPAQLDSVRWSPERRRHAACAAGPAHRRRRRERRGHTGFRSPNGCGSGATTRPTICRASTCNYIGSAGGVFQHGDEFAFDNPAAIEAFRYLVGLINDDHVAPPASDTNDNGDFSRNQFLAGRMALFQSGTYNLAAIADHATLPLGCGDAAERSGGPGKRHQWHCRRWQFGDQTPGRGASGAGLDGQRRGQRVPGRQRRGDPGGADGAAGRTSTTGRPGASTSHRSSRCWTARAFRRRAARASPPDNRHCKPYFDEMFLGRGDVATA